jgi:hypothetical protein
MTDDWSDPINSIRLCDIETLLTQARLEVVGAIKGAAREHSRLKQTKVSRAKGHRPQSWLQRNPKTGRVIGFENSKDIEGDTSP